MMFYPLPLLLAPPSSIWLIYKGELAKIFLQPEIFLLWVLADYSSCVSTISRKTMMSTYSIMLRLELKAWDSDYHLILTSTLVVKDEGTLLPLALTIHS